MSSRLRVAVEITGMMAKEPSGIPIYVKELIKEFYRRRDAIELKYYFKGRLFRKHPDFDDVPGPYPRKYIRRWAPPNTRCPINHSFSGQFLHDRRAINIATIHDVKLCLPEGEGPKWAVDEKGIASHQMRNERIVRGADHLVSVSETTKREYCRLFGLDPAKITVVYPGFQMPDEDIPTDSDELVLERIGIKKKGYLLFTGRIETDKNLIRMLEAFQRSGLHKEFDFVLAGSTVPTTSEIKEKARALGSGSRVKFTGFLSTEDLTIVYRNAKAFVFATYYEGFGLPTLEAMSHGLPVLVGDRGASPEVAAGHAIVVDPYSVDDIAAGMINVASALPDVEGLKAHARQFTWKRSVDQLIDLYKNLLEAR